MKLYLLILLILILQNSAFGYKSQAYSDPERGDSMNESPIIQRTEGFLSKSVPIEILNGNNKRLFTGDNNRFFDVSFEEKLTGTTKMRGFGEKENKDSGVKPKIIQKLDFVSDKAAMKTLNGIVDEINFMNKLS